MRPPPSGFSTYDYTAPLDEAEIIRTARPVTAKGFAMAGLVKEAAAQKKPIPNAPQYLAFKEYPIQENLALSFQIARRLHPDVSIATALRLLGHRAFGAFLESMVGRALLGLPGLRPSHAVKLAPRAYKIVIPSADVSVSVVADDAVIFSFRNFPIVVNSYEIGVLEGGFISKNVPCEIYIKQIAFGEADLFCTWSE
jgi:uncharacterized protein (TIGR02265 family)